MAAGRNIAAAGAAGSSNAAAGAAARRKSGPGRSRKRRNRVRNSTKSRNRRLSTRPERSTLRSRRRRRKTLLGARVGNGVRRKCSSVASSQSWETVERPLRKSELENRRKRRADERRERFTLLYASTFRFDAFEAKKVPIFSILREFFSRGDRN